MADLATVLNVAQGQGAPANPLFNVTNATPNQQDLLNQVYAQYMQRAPDKPGDNFWAGQLQQGMNPQQLAQAFYMSPEASAGGKNPPLPRSQDQNAWKAQAQQQTANLNAMPYVLDPNKLTSDPAANKQLMYPAILQAGAAPYTPVGGKNIGPDLAAKSPGTDFSGAGTLDALVKMVSEKTGMSGDDAHKFIMGLLPNSSTADNGMTSQPDGSGRNIPTDNTAYWNSQIQG